MTMLRQGCSVMGACLVDLIVQIKVSVFIFMYGFHVIESVRHSFIPS